MNESIDVIIPYHNDSKYIKECLYSVLQQKLETYIYILDDNSSDSDKLLEIIKDINSNNIFYFRNKKTLNGAGSRNIGIAKSKSKYICFLDSDDVWMCEKLSRQLNLYQDGTILTSQVFKGKSIEESKILPVIVKNNSEPVSDALFVHNKLIQTSTFFMTSDIAKKVMFNPDLPRHQDYDFLLRAESLGYTIIQDNTPTSFWRVEDDSSDRFLKKKATPEFFIEWFSEYKKYMTPMAQVSYVSKNIFSSCVITKKFKLLALFLFDGNFKFTELVSIFYNVIKWRVNKVFK